MHMHDKIGAALVVCVEKCVNSSRARKAKRHHKKSQNQIMEWVKSFFWAATMVLLINQYVLQAYQIPSGSMRTTLVEQDRIFVDKFIFGPEILPGLGKIPGLQTAQYGDVVIFENPTYVSKGTVYAIMQRILYMVTLSLIDLERNAQGEHQIQLLIKRQIGTDHQQIRIEEGAFYFKAFGADRWYSEAEYMQQHQQHYPMQHLIDAELYDITTRAATAIQYNEIGRPPNAAEVEAINAIRTAPVVDRYHFEHVRSYAKLTTHPHELFRLYRAQRQRNGWYLPAGYFLPLGDNRDNSRDGRYYGIVARDRVLGKARLRYWPLGRIGLVK